MHYKTKDVLFLDYLYFGLPIQWILHNVDKLE